VTESPKWPRVGGGSSSFTVRALFLLQSFEMIAEATRERATPAASDTIMPRGMPRGVGTPRPAFARRAWRERIYLWLGFSQIKTSADRSVVLY